CGGGRPPRRGGAAAPAAARGDVLQRRELEAVAAPRLRRGLRPVPRGRGLRALGDVGLRPERRRGGVGDLGAHVEEPSDVRHLPWGGPGARVHHIGCVAGQCGPPDGL
ncbi:unnamed protein product, partial [Prorocentrum cordatum]